MQVPKVNLFYKFTGPSKKKVSSFSYQFYLASVKTETKKNAPSKISRTYEYAIYADMEFEWGNS